MGNSDGKKRAAGKIRLGRLAIDPVFLGLLVFFLLSAMFMFAYILLSR